MAEINATGSVKGGLASTVVFTDLATTVAIPSWARRMSIRRAGVLGTDDLVVTLTDADGATVAIDALGGSITPWELGVQGQQGTVFRTLAFSGSVSIDTRVTFTGGSYSGPS